VTATEHTCIAAGHCCVDMPVDDWPTCDYCLTDHRRAAAYADGRTVHGPWAWMCKEHFDRFGAGLGLGNGQVLKEEAQNVRG